MPPRHWLSRSHPFAILLRPLAWLFGRLRALRVWLYDFKIFKTYRFSVPVVVVGNVVAGGVGKTPLVITRSAFAAYGLSAWCGFTRLQTKK
jgi:tetraacyldisaccharide 4'-kinase